MYIAVVIGAVVVLIALWLFIWKKTRKSWCVIFYLVGRAPRGIKTWQDPVTGLTAGTLDPKLDDVIQNAIENLPCASLLGVLGEKAWKDVHVVYRAIWDDYQLRPPLAKVVSWRLGAPSAEYFAGESTNPGTIDLTDDLTHFFDWTYDNCPADHYAVFFWGHSFGPSGLFEVGEKPSIPLPPGGVVPPGPAPPGPPPPPASMLPSSLPAGGAVVPMEAPAPEFAFTSLNISELADALLSLVELRELEPGAPTAGQSLKVDVALFQDCWMSTLETIYELQDAARYIIASQSLVPIGYHPNGSIGPNWPYGDLIRGLLSQQNYPDSLLQTLKGHFDNTTDARFPNPTVPFALLDLGPNAGDVSAALTQPMRQLVKTLDVPAWLPIHRHALIAQQNAGELFSFDNPSLPTTLTAGDIALIDLPTLCTYLQTPAGWPAAVAGVLSQPEKNTIIAAAGALQAALNAGPLVRGVFESVNTSTAGLGFGGVSVFYSAQLYGSQAPAYDPYLLLHADFHFYMSLRFAIATSYLTANGNQKSWATYAFE